MVFQKLFKLLKRKRAKFKFLVFKGRFSKKHITTNHLKYSKYLALEITKKLKLKGLGKFYYQPIFLFKKILETPTEI